MSGDQLNKVLLERLDVINSKNGKLYRVRSVTRLSGTTITVVLYHRVGKDKIHVLDMEGFNKLHEMV